ncbi:MAG: hypothetical protein ABI890_09320, partial [Lapillicoccus sp.]
IEPRGAYSLRESAMFGFGGRDASWDDRMRLAFCLDGYAADSRQVGVVLTEPDGPGGVVVGRVASPRGEGSAGGDIDPEAVRTHVARVLSLDHDGRRYDEIGRRDPVIGALQAARPGLRPPQFFSPYEAALWSVLSARRPAQQMAQVRASLSRAYGAVVDLDGEELAAVPTPRQLLAVESFAGIPEVKMARMHVVAQAALDGRLDVAHLTSLDPDAAMRELQELPGIGPFYSALVVIRACGLADVLPTQEPKALELVRQLYGLTSTPSPAELTTLAEPWRPFRTWATVLIRAAGDTYLARRAA